MAAGRQADRNRWVQLKNFIKNSKAELFVFLFSGGREMTSNFVKNLIVEKLCYSNFNSEFEVCMNKSNFTIEVEIQKSAADQILYNYMTLQLPAIILSLFIGNWSDSYGRKLLYLLPLAGCALTNVLYILNVAFLKWPPWMMSVAAIPSGLSGEYAVFMLGQFGYIRDIHSVDDLALRIGLVDGCESLAAELSDVLAAFLYKHFGYYSVFGTAVALFVADFILVLFLINENTTTQFNFIKMAKELFKLSGIINCFKTAFVPRTQHRRTYILLVLLVTVMVFLNQYGRLEILFLFLRLRLNWNAVDISYLSSLNGCSSLIGVFLLMPFLVKKVKMKESTICIFSIIFGIIYNTYIAFAKTSLAMYLSCFLSIPGILRSIICRSFLARCVEKYEIGKIMAFFGVIQAVTKNVGSIVANKIYTSTLTQFPGATFMFLTGCLLIALGVFIWIFWDLNHHSPEKQIAENNDAISENNEVIHQ